MLSALEPRLGRHMRGAVLMPQLFRAVRARPLTCRTCSPAVPAVRTHGSNLGVGIDRLEQLGLAGIVRWLAIAG